MRSPSYQHEAAVGAPSEARLHGMRACPRAIDAKAGPGLDSGLAGNRPSEVLMMGWADDIS
jgi:hypothetical protein